MKSYFEDIVEFHKGIGAPAPEAGDYDSVTDQRRHLRISLMHEELDELKSAIWCDDIVEIADGVADLVVVALGTAVEYGIPFEEIWAEVHRSNMAKIGGPMREDGKALKPEGWSPPDLSTILHRARSLYRAKRSLKS